MWKNPFPKEGLFEFYALLPVIWAERGRLASFSYNEKPVFDGLVGTPNDGFACFNILTYSMVGNQHFQRLKHIYTANPSDPSTEAVAISYGHAEIDGVIEDSPSDGVVNRMPQQKLLSDAASLAAGSVEKERLLIAEHFNVSVEEPGYRGPVVASAEVMVAEPPRYHVHAVLLSETGELVAEAMGIFEPTEEGLPPDPSPEKEEEDESVLSPASFMPIHATKYGVLCLN